MLDRHREDLLRRLALNDERAVETVLHLRVSGPMTGSTLDAKTHALVRLAGVIATGATPASFEWAVATAISTGATDDEVADVLVAIAPVVGLGRVNSAAPDVALALGFDAADAGERDADP
jgi:alkylhydroperoxidase/carboxymuconolactone decarboxylase family protein YurZ